MILNGGRKQYLKTEEGKRRSFPFNELMRFVIASIARLQFLVSWQGIHIMSGKIWTSALIKEIDLLQHCFCSFFYKKRFLPLGAQTELHERDIRHYIIFFLGAREVCNF